MFKNSKEALRIIGNIEGISYLVLLFIAMPLKYIFEIETAVKIVGPLHGILFMLFLYQLYIFEDDNRWGFKFVCVAFISALVPFGTFYLDKKLRV